MLTDALLKRILPNATAKNRKLYLPHLNEAARRYGITTKARLAAWFATLEVESASLRYTSELGVHPEYEGRRDLGNTRKGDGVKYEGHGLIQVTGRANHQAFADYVGRPEIMDNPEIIANDPSLAVQSAAWFVTKYKNLQPFADKGDFLTYSVRVNGRNKRTGLPNHWAERLAAYNRNLARIPDNFEIKDEAEQTEQTSATVSSSVAVEGETVGTVSAATDTDADAASPLPNLTEKLNTAETVATKADTISKSSLWTTISTKIGGWGFLLLGFLQDNWVELLIGAVLIGVAVWYFSRSKDRLQERVLTK